MRDLTRRAYDPDPMAMIMTMGRTLNCDRSFCGAGDGRRLEEED